MMERKRSQAASGGRSSGRRATMTRVAEELGVSSMTISNAYNRPERVSEYLREQIFETAERLGYAGPDPVARSLRRQKTNLAGVLYSNPLSYAFGDAARARARVGGLFAQRACLGGDGRDRRRVRRLLDRRRRPVGRGGPKEAAADGDRGPTPPGGCALRRDRQRIGREEGGEAPGRPGTREVRRRFVLHRGGRPAPRNRRFASSAVCDLTGDPRAARGLRSRPGSRRSSLERSAGLRMLRQL